MEILANAFVLSLTIYFFKATTWPGMIFEKLGKWIEETLGSYWSKPVIGCPVCMTPWWGSLLYTILYYMHVPNFHPYANVIPIAILTIFAAAGISVVILMLNKEYDVAKKEDKLLKKEMEEEGVK